MVRGHELGKGPLWVDCHHAEVLGSPIIAPQTQGQELNVLMPRTDLPRFPTKTGVTEVVLPTLLGRADRSPRQP